MNFLFCFHIVPVLVDIDREYMTPYITHHDVSYGKEQY